MTQRYDVVALGGAPVGENAAAAARDNGSSVAVVERDLDDGTWLEGDDLGLDTVGLEPGAPLDVDELLHAATVAIVGGITLDRLRHAVPAFPTLSEVWVRLFERDGTA